MTRTNRQALQVLFVLIVLAAGIFWLVRDLRPKLTVFAWDGYFAPDVLREFERRYRANIILKTYRNNDELVSRLKVSWSEYDVIMPSSHVIDDLRRRRLLESLGAREVPNIANIDVKFMDGSALHEEDVKYGLPFFINYAGIGYVTRLVPNPPQTWREFFGTSLNRVYGEEIAVLDEQRETLGLALIGLGFSPSTVDEGELEQLRMFLREQRAAGEGPRFVLLEGRMMLETNEITLLSTWSPEVAMAERTSDGIEHILPAEGSIRTVDTLAVPRNSRQKVLAKKFVNFLLEPTIARRLTDYNGYPNSLRADLIDLTEEQRNSASFIEPSPDKIFTLQGVGDALHLYDEIWAEYRGHLVGP